LHPRGEQKNWLRRTNRLVEGKGHPGKKSPIDLLSQGGSKTKDERKGALQQKTRRREERAADSELTRRLFAVKKGRKAKTAKRRRRDQRARGEEPGKNMLG